MEWPALAHHPLDAIVTTRDGGVSAGPFASLNLGLHVGDDADAVIENRARAAAALGASIDDMVFCEQAHLPTVVVVAEEHRGRGARSREDAIPATDALVTVVPDLLLVVMVADCVPVVLFDPVRRVLACVHAGWGGTVRAVTTAAIAAMTSLGTDPTDLVAGIGPSISPARYQVGEDVVAAADTAFPGRLDDVIRPDGTGRWLFDLWRANELQLLAAGVDPAAIHVARMDTGPGTAFFSDRAQRPCGRFALLARLRPV